MCNNHKFRVDPSNDEGDEDINDIQNASDSIILELNHIISNCCKISFIKSNGES